jgi:hypothetical protein
MFGVSLALRWGNPMISAIAAFRLKQSNLKRQQADAVS